MKITSKISDLCLTIYVEGELDENSAKQLKIGFASALESKDYLEVVIDLAGASFLDSTAVGIILSNYRVLTKNNKSLYVKNVNSQIDKVFTTLGIYQIIKKR